MNRANCTCALAAALAGCLSKPAPPDVTSGICAPGGSTIDMCEPAATVPSKITIGGAISDNAGTPLVGVTVQTEPGNGFDTTHASPVPGAFLIDVDTNDSPVPACARITASGFPVHERHALRPLTAAMVDWSTKLLSPADLQMLYSGAGVAVDPAKATVMAIVSDCSDARVSGATVRSEPAPQAIVYFGGGAATNPTGVAFLLGVPPGNVELQAAASSAAYELSVRAGDVYVVDLTQ